MKCIEEKNKPSILFVLHSFQPLPMGGAETQTKRLSRVLISLGYNISVLTQGRTGLPPFEIIDGVKVFRVNSFFNRVRDRFYFIYKKIFGCQKKNDVINHDEMLKKFGPITGLRGITWDLFFFLSSCWFFIKYRRKYHVIQVNILEIMAVIAAFWGKRLNKKVVIKDATMNGLTKLAYAPCGKIFQKYIMKNCHFVAMTNYIEGNFIKTGVPVNKITKIPNGIEIIEVNTNDKKFDYRCLFVGNLYQQPAKGVDVLLKAWVTVHEAYSRASLTIVGAGSTVEYYDFVKELGIGDSVHFVGNRPSQKYYLNSDIFILPSRREGMSNALLEAMMYKLGIVATDISGNQDLIKDHVNGLLISTEDIGQLSNAIIYLLENPSKCEEFGINAQNTIKSLCDINIVGHKYDRLYKTILAE